MSRHELERVAAEIEAAVGEYSGRFPEPFNLAPNLELATRALACARELAEEVDAQENFYQIAERLTDQLRVTEENISGSVRTFESSASSLRSMLSQARDSMSSLWLALQNRH